MLYVIYGLTLNVSKVSRDYFTEKGIKNIDKINFETDNIKARPSDGRLNRASYEEVMACDYRYESHGRIVGFTAEQISDAVSGKTDARLTFSSTDLQFLRELKNAYGNHVVIIFTYIEDKTLEKITNALPASDEEKNNRLEMGLSIKEHFFSDRDIFDEVVLYSGEDTVFNLENLKSQYDHIIKKYKNLEKELVPLPYTGNKPYLFVSYARKDTDKVVPYLKALQSHGCRIWYDKGIRAGDNWMTTLAMKIKGCSQYLLFSSENSTISRWTKREVSRAIAREDDMPIVTVRLDDARFDEGIEMCLEDYQQLFADHEDFEKKLFESIDESIIEHIG